MRVIRSLKLVTHQVILAIAIISILGCWLRTIGSIEMTIPMKGKLSRDQTLYVSVSSQISDSTYESLHLENMLVASLKGKGVYHHKSKRLFEKVGAGSTFQHESADLRLNVLIVGVRKMNPLKWILVPFSGFIRRAHIVADAELIDLQTGMTIGAFRVIGKSRLHQTGTINQALEEAVKQIVQFLEKNVL